MTYLDLKSLIKSITTHLTFIGLWPNVDNFFTFSKYTAYTFVILVYLNSFVFSQLINIYFVFDNLELLISTVVISISSAVTYVKMYYYLKNWKVIRDLIKSLNKVIFQPRNEKQRNIILAKFSLWRRMFIIFFCSSLSTKICWLLFPVFGDYRQKRSLVFPAWYPYNYKISPLYEITHFHQVTGILLVANIHIGIDCFITALMAYITVECMILSDTLENMHEFARTRMSERNVDQSEKIQENYGQGMNDMFKECAKHYQEITRFSTKLGAFLNLSVLGEFATSLVALCTTLFQITVVEQFSIEFFSFIFYGVTMFIQLSLYCWWGNEVTTKSEYIPIAVYKLLWVDESMELKRNILHLMGRSQKPIKLYAAKLFPLSLETLTKILRSAASYFAVLRQLHDK